VTAVAAEFPAAVDLMPEMHYCGTSVRALLSCELQQGEDTLQVKRCSSQRLQKFQLQAAKKKKWTNW